MRWATFAEDDTKQHNGSTLILPPRVVVGNSTADLVGVLDNVLPGVGDLNVLLEASERAVSFLISSSFLFLFMNCRNTSPILIIIISQEIEMH